MKKLILSLIFATTFIIAMQGQVTIGSNNPPSKAALLDIKDKDATNPITVTDDANITSTKGGLVLPRVKLVDPVTLEPFIPTTDTEWTSAATSKIKEKHAGLMVYNLTVNTNFAQGIYIWNGSKWVIASGLAENGLTETNGVIRLGGDLTQDTEIDLKDKGLTIDIDASSTKGFMIKNLQTQLNSGYLVADYTTGRIGWGPDIPAVMAFMQSATATPISTNAIRSGIVVPWATSDIITNSELVDLDDGSAGDANSFIMKKDANVEISAYVCYIGGGVPYNNTTPMEIVVNATIQIKKAGGSWVDYSSVRGVYANSVSYYINTLNVPPVLLSLNQGDKVRLRLIQPPNETSPSSVPNGGVAGYLGANHSSANIAKPYGTQFSKGMKIIVQ